MGKELAKSKLAVDPAEAEIVRRIYAKYLAGAGAKAIANEFNQEGLLRRGRLWSKNNILAIIGDESFVGRYYYNKTTGRQKKPNPRSEWILIPVDPIIDEPTWKRAKALKESRNPVTNKVTPSAITTKTLLTGIAKCGLCGASFALETAKSGRYTYYNCSSYFRKGKATCPGQRIAADKLESAVLDHLTRRLFTRDRLKKLLAGVYQ